MPDKDPNNWELTFWAFLTGLGLTGGIIRYIEDYRKELQHNPNTPHKFTLVELLGKAFSSAFACIVIYFICKGLKIDDLVALGLSGVASYFGTESLGVVFQHFNKNNNNNDH